MSNEAIFWYLLAQAILFVMGLGTGAVLARMKIQLLNVIRNYALAVLAVAVVAGIIAGNFWYGILTFWILGGSILLGFLVMQKPEEHPLDQRSIGQHVLRPSQMNQDQAPPSFIGQNLDQHV